MTQCQWRPSCRVSRAKATSCYFSLNIINSIRPCFSSEVACPRCQPATHLGTATRGYDNFRYHIRKVHGMRDAAELRHAERFARHMVSIEQSLYMAVDTIVVNVWCFKWSARQRNARGKCENLADRYYVVLGPWVLPRWTKATEANMICDWQTTVNFRISAVMFHFSFNLPWETELLY